MNGLSGLMQSRKAWYVTGVIAAGQALVQTNQLPATWWWVGSCIVAGLYVVAHAIQERGAAKPVAEKAKPEPPPASG